MRFHTKLQNTNRSPMRMWLITVTAIESAGKCKVTLTPNYVSDNYN